MSEIPTVVDAIGKGIMTFDQYKTQYAESIANPSDYWKKQALERLDWESPPTVGLQGSLAAGDVAWFPGGKLNMCYNAVDRHVLAGKGDQVALVWEGDEPTDIRRITYRELQHKVCAITNAFIAKGVRAGDVVTVYMPMSKCRRGLCYNRKSTEHDLQFNFLASS